MKLAIVVTTFFPEGEAGDRRSARAIESLESWDDHLLFEPESSAPDVLLLQQDDASPNEAAALRFQGAALRLHWNAVYERGRGGVGASLNRGLRDAFDHGYDVVLYAVDDWSLRDDFKIAPWVRLLEAQPRFGCVRLGPPHPGLIGTVLPVGPEWEHWAFVPSVPNGFIVGHRPALWHRRFFDALGPWKENVDAYECEAEMNERYCRLGALAVPGVILALPHPWYHLQEHEGNVELAHYNPLER